jgi:hypothetical protein
MENHIIPHQGGIGMPGISGETQMRAVAQAARRRRRLVDRYTPLVGLDAPTASCSTSPVAPTYSAARVRGRRAGGTARNRG